MRSALRPDGVAPPGGHYSHGVIVETARTLYVAGQVALDQDGQLVGPGDAEAQARQVLSNLQRVIEAAGGRLEDVAKTTVLLTDLDHRQPVDRVRREFFRGDPPANTLLVVASLARPEFLVEIEAVVPLGRTRPLTPQD
ncbi:MAG: RidA family protein [Acidimicrobiia bacterium]